MNNFTQEQAKLKNHSSTIFDENNIVDEDIFQVQIINDIYRAAEIVDIDSTIKELCAMDTISQQMNNNCEEFNEHDIVTEPEPVQPHKTTMEAAVGFINVANDLYNLATKGTKCSVCGKYVRFMPPNGYCSLECAAKDLVKRIMSHITGEFETETPEIITKVKRILNYIDLCLNLVQKLPDILSGLASFPPEYKAYATVKVNIIFLYIKKVINNLLIEKNKLLIKLLKKCRDGVIDSKTGAAVAQIQQVLTVIRNLRTQMNQAIGIALQAITNLSALFYIGPQEYGFFMTMKSFMCPCPFLKSNPNLYPPSQIGTPFWGPGVMMIPFDMSKCQFSIDIGGMSALQNVDQKKIDNIINAVFRPIMEVEYLMDPELFDIRLALSDQNTPAIQKLQRMLELTVTIGGDFLPTYKNLKLTNIWFVIAILTCWGPTTRYIFGDFIFHAPI